MKCPFKTSLITTVMNHCPETYEIDREDENLDAHLVINTNWTKTETTHFLNCEKENCAAWIDGTCMKILNPYRKERN